MTAPAYDIYIGGKGYLLNPGGWNRSESPKSYPSNGGASSVEFRHGDNWSYFGQDEWNGEGTDLWHGNGPFFSSYGIDLSKYGQIKIAKQLAVSTTDVANTGGYLMFAVGTTRMVAIGKTDGKLYDDTHGNTAQKTPGDLNYLPVGVFPISYGYYKATHYVGATDGKLYSTTDGLAYTQVVPTGTPATNAYILGSFRGKLYVAYANRLFTFDGTTWKEIFAGVIDGTLSMSCVASAQLYMVTAGPQAKIYSTDGNQLHQLGAVSTRFMPYGVVSCETVYFFGATSDAANTKGEVWRISNGALELVFNFGDGTTDCGIRSAITENGLIYWGANQKTGLGIYDSRIDLYQDIQTGFYVSSTITSVAGVVNGIVLFNGTMYCGIQGQGIYKQTTPGTFKLRSCLFDADSRNINKLWGFSEIKHLPLVAGQSVSIASLVDEATVVSWGTSSTLGASGAIINAPNNTQNGFIRYEISGDANGSPLTITSVALAYMELAANPKREWDLAIAIEGSSDQPQRLRDGSDSDRTGQQMLSALDALWNTYTTFTDIDATTYNVVLKHPMAHAEDIIRDQDAGGTLQNLYVVYRLHLTQL